MNPRLEKLISFPVYQKVLILILTMSLFGAGFYFAFYSKQLNEEKNLLTQKDQASQLLKKNQKIANNLPKFQAEYENILAQLNDALNELPLEREIPTLLTSIADLAGEKGLDIIKFQPGKETLKGFYAEVPVSLKLSGSYHQAGVFFDAVSRLDRIVNIQGLSMGGAKEIDGKTTLNIDCQAITFRFVEKSNDNPPKKKGGKRK